MLARLLVIALTCCLTKVDCEMTLSSVLAPTPPLSQERLLGINWTVAGYMFIYVSDPGGSATDGTLMYLNLGNVSHMGVFQRPLSRMLMSGNIAKWANSGSYPGNPHIHEPLPSVPSMVVGSGPKGATLSDRAPEPSGTNPPKRLSDVKAADILNANRTFILSGEVYGGSAIRRVCFSDPMATIAPAEHQLMRVLRTGTDRSETVMRIGRGFAVLTMSQYGTTPIEVVLTPRSKPLSILWPSFVRTEPVHSTPKTAYKTYVLGSGLELPDRDYKSMVDIAGSADESIDARFQSARLHAMLLLFAANTQAEEDPYLLRLIITRAWMTVFSQAQTALSSGYAVLDEMIGLEADLKMLCYSVPRVALGGEPDSLFFEPNSPLESSHGIKRLLSEAVEGAISEATREDDLEKRRRVLTAVYAMSEPPSKSALALAVATMEWIYDAGVWDRLPRNSTVGKVVFYSSALVLGQSPSTPGAKASARHVLLMATSVCTDERAAAGDVDVQEAYLTVTQKRLPFHVLDAYTPCAVSLRADLSDYPHRLFAAIAASGRPGLTRYLGSVPKLSGGGPAEEERLENRAAHVVSRWQEANSMVLQDFVSEVVVCGPDTLASAVLVLPVAENASYVVGRRNAGHGLVYKVEGVSVDNQLFITYTSGVCGSSTYGSTAPVKLPRPNAGECPYCGCVVLRYDASGTVRYAIYVADLGLQKELVASVNSSVRYFNPTMSADAYGTTLLLFPNGTVVRLISFDSERKTALSAMYIASAVVGCLLAIVLLGVTIRMIVGAVSGSIGGGKSSSDKAAPPRRAKKYGRLLDDPSAASYGGGRRKGYDRRARRSSQRAKYERLKDAEQDFSEGSDELV